MRFFELVCGVCLKALVNEDTLLRTHCCPWCSLGCVNWETFVADTKCFWTKPETFFVSRTQNLCPQQMLRARANGKHSCRQQCVRNNVSSFARAFITFIPPFINRSSILRWLRGFVFGSLFYESRFLLGIGRQKKNAILTRKPEIHVGVLSSQTH